MAGRRVDELRRDETGKRMATRQVVRLRREDGDTIRVLLPVKECKRYAGRGHTGRCHPDTDLRGLPVLLPRGGQGRSSCSSAGGAGSGPCRGSASSVASIRLRQEA